MEFSIHAHFDATAIKRLSYILVIKNRAAFLEAALAMYRRLLGPDDELIVIDGGSTDGSLALLEKHKDIIHVVVSEPDISVGHAFNKGILLARGKYVKQCADDDILHKAGIEHALSVLDQYPDIGLLLCGGAKRRGDKEWVVYLSPGIRYGKEPDDAFRYRGIASGTGHVIRRSACAKAGLQPTGPNSDAELVLRFIRAGVGIKFCRVNLYTHTIYKHSVGSRQAVEHMKDTIRLLREYCSLRFAIRYYTTTLLPIQLRWSRFRIARFVGRQLKKLWKPKRISPEECVWDGGLSA